MTLLLSLCDKFFFIISLYLTNCRCLLYNEMQIIGNSMSYNQFNNELRQTNRVAYVLVTALLYPRKGYNGFFTSSTFLNQFIFNISIQYSKNFFLSKFLIHREAHCQKCENSNIYNSKTANDILKNPTDLSSGGQKPYSVRRQKKHQITVHCKKN